jgi:hypothetical protein
MFYERGNLMPRGSAILEAAATRIEQERNRAVISHACCWCNWTMTATLGECRVAHRAHVASEHPEITMPEPQRRKRRANAPRTLGTRTVGENIALARAQGAASWTEDDILGESGL